MLQDIRSQFIGKELKDVFIDGDGRVVLEFDNNQVIVVYGDRHNTLNVTCAEKIISYKEYR